MSCLAMISISRRISPNCLLGWSHMVCSDTRTMFESASFSRTLWYVNREGEAVVDDSTMEVIRRGRRMRCLIRDVCSSSSQSHRSIIRGSRRNNCFIAPLMGRVSGFALDRRKLLDGLNSSSPGPRENEKRPSWYLKVPLVYEEDEQNLESS